MFPWFLLKLSYRCILLSTVLLPLLQWHLPRWFSTNGILLLKILNQYFSKIELGLISNLLEEDSVFLSRFCVSVDRSWRRCGCCWTGRQLWKRRCLTSWKRPYRSAWTFFCNIYFIFYSFRWSWGPWRGRRSTGGTWPRSPLIIKIPCWRTRTGWGGRWFSFDSTFKIFAKENTPSSLCVLRWSGRWRTSSKLWRPLRVELVTVWLFVTRSQCGTSAMSMFKWLEEKNPPTPPKNI